MSEEYKKGFDEGLKYTIETFDPQTGVHTHDLPNWFHHRGDVRSCGFGEGIITGRSEVLNKTFPGYKEIGWPGGKVEVKY